MVSSVKEEDITELRAAGYLAKEIAHRLPAEGQVVPTPKPTERVVFIPHFFQGLGFPLHPFIRGLIYYYWIDFEDLSPNSSSISRRLSSCVRPSSASNPTLGYGSKSSM